MSNSVLADRQGPDWPLGIILVPTPGTPVNIMNLVDANNTSAPAQATPDANGVPYPMYTIRAQQIIFQAVKPGASHGTQNNTGNVYIVRKGTGSSNRDDLGAIVKTLIPGETFFLGSSAQVKDVFSPYRYFLDADNANDAALVTLLIF